MTYTLHSRLAKTADSAIIFHSGAPLNREARQVDWARVRTPTPTTSVLLQVHRRKSFSNSAVCLCPARARPGERALLLLQAEKAERAPQFPRFGSLVPVPVFRAWTMLSSASCSFNVVPHDPECSLHLPGLDPLSHVQFPHIALARLIPQAGISSPLLDNR